MDFPALLLFLAVVLLVAGAIHAFLYRRLVRGLGITSPRARRVLRAAAALLAIAYPLTRWLDAWAPDSVVLGAHWIAALWLGLMFHLLWLGLGVWLVKLLLAATGLWRRLAPRHALLGRLGVGAVLTAALVLCGLGLAGARQAAVVREVSVPVKGFTPALGRLRIAVFADLHAGVLVDAAQVARRVDEVLALQCDLILIPGDVLDHPPRRLAAVARELARLDAPLGVFATTGNHEYYIEVEEALAFLRESGIRVLMNERVEVTPGLVIAGIEDRTALTMGRALPTRAQILGEGARRKATIFLDHTPASAGVEAAIAAGADLCLSGHTHGGQIWPFGVFTRLAFPYHHGVYRVGAGSQLTTCGLGWWGPPMRLGAPPEIYVVTLVGM